MSQLLIFVNPIAGSGRGRGMARLLERAFGQHGWKVVLFDRPAREIESAQLPSSIDAMIVIGGDGTLRAVIQRMLELKGLAEVPPILIAPLGTANLMARHLSIQWDRRRLGDQIAAAIEQCRIAELDVATANDRLFLAVAGVGIDAAIVHELDRLRRGAITYVSYALPALEALRCYNYPKLSVTVDGRSLIRNQPSMVFVGNIAEYGTGFPILTEAKSNDQLLDVCILPCESPQALARLAMATATGHHLQEEGAIYTRGRSIQIESPEPVAVQIDGDPAGQTPLDIELLPTKLRFIVP